MMGKRTAVFLMSVLLLCPACTAEPGLSTTLKPIQRSTNTKGNADCPPIVLIAGVTTGGLLLIVVIVFVVIIIVKSQRETSDHADPGVQLATSSDGYLEPVPRRQDSADMDGYTYPTMKPAASSHDYLQPIAGPEDLKGSDDYTNPNMKPAASSHDYLEPIAGPENQTGPYESLQMDEVGQRSVYSGLRSHGNHPAPKVASRGGNL